MVRVVWAKPALDDLEGIYDYIAQDSPRYAQLTVEKITTAASRLGQFPRMGEVMPEFPEEVYRQFVVRPYRLVYREDPQQDRVLVVGVIHGARQLPPRLEGR